MSRSPPLFYVDGRISFHPLVTRIPIYSNIFSDVRRNDRTETILPPIRGLAHSRAISAIWNTFFDALRSSRETVAPSNLERLT